MKSNNSLTTAVLLFSLLVLSVGSSFAQFGIGADVVSRYVWRGTDFGNAAAVQPAISYTAGSLEVGAWGSWAINGAAGGNENDLYASYSFGDFGLTLTDYFFPTFGEDEFFDYGDDTGAHSLEISGSYSAGALSFLAGYFFTGVEGIKESLYLEAGYEIPLSTEDISASLVVGAGNEQYTTDGDFGLVQVGVSVSKDAISASYLINPEKETAFLVFGYSF